MRYTLSVGAIIFREKAPFSSHIATRSHPSASDNEAPSTSNDNSFSLLLHLTPMHKAPFDAYVRCSVPSNKTNVNSLESIYDTLLMNM